MKQSLEKNLLAGVTSAPLPIIVLCCCVLLAATGISQAALVDDQSISDAIEDELRRDHAVSTPWIDITTHQGVVTLSGRVDNILAKNRAVRIAETVKGVRSVVDRIQVFPAELRTDIQIEDDVVEALTVDPATDSYEVDVSVNNNIVTLTGTVDSWQEKHLCRMVTMGVRGVKGVKNLLDIEIQGDREDYEIKQEIEQALRWDMLVDHALIDVNVKDGVVDLSGTVGSLAERRRAIADAHVANVQVVDAAGLEVRYWARDPKLRGNKYKDVTDEEIRKAIKDALLYDPRVISAKVDPEVESGIVTLRGTVDNLKAKEAAAMDARHTVGVITVENRLKVRPERTYSDDVLENRIKRAFRRDPYIEETGIAVVVRNGIVDLIGSVDTYVDSVRAEDLATRVNGVVAVNNHIVVNGGLAPYPYEPYVDDWTTGDFDYRYDPPLTFKSDLEIEKDIENEFFWSPFVDSDDIDVRVDNGTAILTGKVDTLSEFKAAGRNAYEGGAVVVHNKLEVR